MRYAFGLVGLLVVLGVIVWIMGGKGGELDQAKTALETREKLEPQLNQLAGRDASGASVAESAALSPQMNGGKLRGLLVSELTPGGAYEKHFGLKQYDLIVEIGPMDVQMFDAEAAKVQVMDAYQRDQSIVVQRGAEKITLPASIPGVERPQGLQGQLDAIKKIPMH
ncbi:hypothetical protein BH10PLA1_BH10PLA1_05230 [soil metagenome]